MYQFKNNTQNKIKIENLWKQIKAACSIYTLGNRVFLLMKFDQHQY